ncbi:hypothetical protein CBR64_20500 [Cellulosimicrobium cellulans]|uniref:Uncharacterized protein n=1 Tax=Cellulosimicrobium cellulans TaxID=1710 RepID=A0A1Y0HZ30_CELCE|nr:hypothetical protein CBR64_20500 [Cellulosimicrobium cellulans]
MPWRRLRRDGTKALLAEGHLWHHCDDPPADRNLLADTGHDVVSVLAATNIRDIHRESPALLSFLVSIDRRLTLDRFKQFVL